MSAIITIQFTVGPDYRPGDYAHLHGNSGSGAIDWETPLTREVLDLFPDGAGLAGYGHAPYGHYPYGHASAMDTPGYGHCPYGHYPFGHGAVTIEANIEVASCGSYIFGFAVYDTAGNAHSGTPEETTVEVHTAGAAPSGLKFNSYNKTTDVLILDIV